MEQHRGWAGSVFDLALKVGQPQESENQKRSATASEIAKDGRSRASGSGTTRSPMAHADRIVPFVPGGAAQGYGLLGALAMGAGAPSILEWLRAAWEGRLGAPQFSPDPAFLLQAFRDVLLHFSMEEPARGLRSEFPEGDRGHDPEEEGGEADSEENADADTRGGPEEVRH